MGKFDRNKYTKDEIKRMKAEIQEQRRQDRYLARVAYRAEIRAARKEENDIMRSENRQIRVEERGKMREIEKKKRQEAKIKLLSRTRRSSKKAKNSKKRGKL